MLHVYHQRNLTISYHQRNLTISSSLLSSSWHWSWQELDSKLEEIMRFLWWWYSTSQSQNTKKKEKTENFFSRKKGGDPIPEYLCDGRGKHMYSFLTILLFYFKCFPDKKWSFHMVLKKKSTLVIFHLTRQNWRSDVVGPSWSCSCGSWIYNYICNQCLLPLKLSVRTPYMARCTRYNIMW